MAMIPLALAGIPALLGSVGAIMDIVKKAKGGAARRAASGSALSVISKYPLLERRSRYRKGGATIAEMVDAVARSRTLRPPRKRGKGGATMAEMINAVARTRTLRPPPRRGKGPVADFLSNIPLLGMVAGPIARALGGKYIRPHLSHTKYGVPVYVKGYNRSPARGMGGVYVPPHISYTKYGAPVRVRGYTRGKGLLYPAGASPRGRGLLSPAGGFLPYTTI